MSIPLSLLAAVVIGHAEPASGLLPGVQAASFSSSVTGSTDQSWYRGAVLYMGIAAVTSTFIYALSRGRQAN